MNTPTPLGKTYEQYKKELKEFKEFNLSKVEKVELSLVDDLAKATKKAESYIKKNEKQIIEFAKLKPVVDKAADDWKMNFADINGLTQKVYQGAKELGLTMKEASQNTDVKKGADMRSKLEDFRGLLRKAGVKI